MKVNGNHNAKAAINKSTTDLLSKKAVEVVEDIPVKDFDPSKTWEKLSSRLGQIDKRFVTWGLTMAASFSLLVAANVDVFLWNSLDEQPIKKNVVVTKEDHNEEIAHLISNPTVLTALEAIPLAKTNEPIMKLEISPLPVNRTHTELIRDKKEQRKVEVTPFSNPFVFVFAKVNFQTESVSPEFGLDFKFAENYTAKRRDIYKLGISSQLNFTTSETGKKKVYPHTFVNLEFASLNKKTNKGWTTRAGYLINPDGQLFQDTTIKVSLFRNVGKHLKVGPEVIFTDNLKKSYPSISLVLG
ncbi:hypothetical protein [Reichenbachiella sp.]|uniref:hypothetical protein n=2 Tax=Reichenbachiella sp. TaxID=2184521 RepID=UPI00329966AB